MPKDIRDIDRMMVMDNMPINVGKLKELIKDMPDGCNIGISVGGGVIRALTHAWYWEQPEAPFSLVLSPPVLDQGFVETIKHLGY